MAVVTFEETPFPEKGTRGVQMVFRDTDGALRIPTEAKFKLTTYTPEGEDPTVINNRDWVAVDDTLGSTMVQVLKGNDLAFLSAETDMATVERAFTIKFTYNSVSLGNGVVDYAQFVFPIENMMGVPES